MQVEPYINSVLKLQDFSTLTNAKLNRRKQQNIIQENDGLTVKYSPNTNTLELASFLISIGLAFNNCQINQTLGFFGGSIEYYSDGKVVIKKQEIDQKMKSIQIR
ncbi:unnamed protein product [Paramecium pentaurelia]|uniref:Uncharacterized protein n=1 Tax=Paramecium pentaurelia TaxID=43138 RepID=A0A8S1TZZ0_9CILI|nr:unnamed protein product [Paramecium pentaurelia]